MLDNIFSISFRCYYPDGGKSNHRQDLRLQDIARWVDSYKFTHPNCDSISVRIWFGDEATEDE